MTTAVVTVNLYESTVFRTLFRKQGTLPASFPNVPCISDRFENVFSCLCFVVYHILS